MALNRRSLETTISSRTRDLDAFVSILIDNRGPQHRLAIEQVVDVQLLLRFKEPEGFLLRAPCILWRSSSMVSFRGECTARMLSGKAPSNYRQPLTHGTRET
jgi:hypothetical protein